MNIIYKGLIVVGIADVAWSVKKGIDYLKKNIENEIDKEIDRCNAEKNEDMQAKEREATLSKLCADSRVKVRSHDEFIKALDDIYQKSEEKNKQKSKK